MDENENKFRDLKYEKDGSKLKFFRHTCQPWGNPWTIGWKLSHSYHNLVSSIRGIIKPKAQYYNTGSQKSNTGWELKKINENENEISKVKVWKWNSSTFQKPEISCHIGRIGRGNARTIDLETPLSLGKYILMPTISWLWRQKQQYHVLGSSVAQYWRIIEKDEWKCEWSLRSLSQKMKFKNVSKGGTYRRI